MKDYRMLNIFGTSEQYKIPNWRKRCNQRRDNKSTVTENHHKEMKIIGIFCLLGILIVGLVDGQACDRRSNGCSDPTNGPYKQRFKPTCDKHDVCYSCGQRYGIDRARCDKIFHNNMKRYCSSVSSSERQKCNEEADSYYKWVQRLGRFFYEDPAESWCNQAWVRPCI